MTDHVIADDGSIADIPWASVFDPDHNVRAFNAVQERGFRAASAVVERLVGAVTSDTAAAPTQAAAPVTDEPASDIQRAVTTWQSLLTQIVGATPPGAPTTPAGAVVVDLNADGHSQVAYLEVDSGGSGSVEVWLHNGAASDMEPMTLRCSDLLSHDGHTLKSTAVHIDPPHLVMPGRCSRGVVVSVEVTADVRPGRYRGTLLAVAHPDVWLPIVVSVAAPAPA